MVESNKMKEMPVNKLMVQMGIPMILSMALQNDAGMSIGSPFEDMELESMLKIIDLNCKGATAITKVCLQK